MSKIAAITCARMDSKRFPGKCLALLDGKPLIDYTVQFAEQLHIPLYLWTRDTVIMAATQGFCRIIYEPIELYDTPYNSTISKMRYANKIIDADMLVILQPTSPIRSAKLVKYWLQEFERSKANYAESYYVNHEAITFQEGEPISNGAFFAYKRSLLDGKEEKEEIKFQDEYCFDINTIQDLEEAEKWIKARL